MTEIAKAVAAPAAALPSPPSADRVETLRAAATAFEATFLAEMLKHAGLGRSTPGFDGGAGEAAFGGELVAAQADLLARRGGIGIAQRLFEAMLAREGAGDAR
jgi:Rod binding domain-containing protein